MSEYKFNVTGKERKALASAISEILNQTIKYLGAPTFVYEIGGYRIDKAGTVTGEYDLNLFVGLAERNFEPEISPIPAEETVEPEVIPTAEETPDTVAQDGKKGLLDILSEELNASDVKCERLHSEPTIIDDNGKQHSLNGQYATTPEYDEKTLEPSDHLTVEVPNDFTPEQIDNIAKMTAAKEPLLKKALRAEELPIRVTEDKISFPWFTLERSEDTAYYVQFIYALCKTAKEKKRINAKSPESFENEKFSMRVWLIGLGLIGKEYGKCRKLMGKNLGGESGWRYGKPEKKADIEHETADISEETEAASNE